MFSKRRNIHEFSCDLSRYDIYVAHVYFKKVNRRWFWGFERTSQGIKYNEHPFATQREAKEAAQKYIFELKGIK